MSARTRVTTGCSCNQNDPVATLDPAVALTTCETALREIMTYAYSAAYEAEWLSKVATPDKVAEWVGRPDAEFRVRGPKGVVSVPSAGLGYANFYDLVSIADGHWEPLAPALGKKASAISLLKRFDNLRNSVGHSRPLLKFEQDLMSGIAGQIRNQVTIFMSTQDEVGDIYPRIESITDAFGRRVESFTVDGEMAGAVASYDVVLHPGDTVVFECLGVDPQDRDLAWTAHSSGGTSQTVLGPSGVPASLAWRVADSDVSESATLQVYLATNDVKYHRFGTWDHRGWFGFRVRPPA